MFLTIFSLFLLISTLFIADAYAYIDPGSGSLIIQVIIGALIGVGFTVKMYWEKIKFKLSGLSQNKKDE